MMKIFAVTFFLGVFVVYITGVSPSVFGGDSGDIILASWFGGVAHPPGYPLNTMLGWVFTHFPYNASVAYKADVAAAFFQAAVVAITFLICKKLTKNIFASLAASLTLAFVTLFWLYAHVFEVFQLNLVLISACFYFLISWRESILQKGSTRKFLYLGLFFYGLSVFHHQTSALITPAVFYLLYKTDKALFKNKKELFKLIAFFSLGFLPYLFVPFAAIRQTPINWDDPRNIGNFLRLITRAGYGSFVAMRVLLGASLWSRVLAVYNYSLFLVEDFKIIGLGIFSLGFIYSFIKFRFYFWLFFIAIFFTGPLFLFYAGLNFPNEFSAGIWERFFLLSYLFIAVFIAFGYLAVHRLLIRLVSRIIRFQSSMRIFFGIVFGIFLVLFPIRLAVLNISKADFTSFWLGDALGFDVLSSAEENAIVFTFGDTLAFNTDYVYYTNPEFKSLKVIKGGSLRRPDYRRLVASEYPELVLPSKFFADEWKNGAEYIGQIIDHNLNKFPIYSSEYTAQVEGYGWYRTGLLKKLVSHNVDELNYVVDTNEEKLSRFMYRDFSKDLGYSHYLTENIKEIYYFALLGIADELASLNNISGAYSYIDKSRLIMPEKNEAYIKLGDIFTKHKNCETAREYYTKAATLTPNGWIPYSKLGRLYLDCFEDSEKAEFYFNSANEKRNRGLITDPNKF